MGVGYSLLRKLLTIEATHTMAANVLGMIRSQRALDLLIESLLGGRYHGTAVPIAIAKIDDRRAIEPLCQCLSSFGFNAYVIALALVRLGDVRGFRWLWSDYKRESASGDFTWGYGVMGLAGLTSGPQVWQILGTDELSNLRHLTDEEIGRVPGAYIEKLRLLRDLAQLQRNTAPKPV